MSIKSIAVVGGGIGGLASAIFLGRMGFSVTIYERAIKPEPVGAGFLLQPPGHMVLDMLGLLDIVRSRSVPILRLTSATVSGKKLLDLHYSDLNGAPRTGLGVQRSTIYNALYTAATDCPDVEFKWDCRVSDCRCEDDAGFVTVDAVEYQHDLCLLTSGSNSSLADAHFEGRVRSGYQWGCLWSTIRLPDGLLPNTLHQRCLGSQKMLGILPVVASGDGYDAALYWSVKVDEYRNKEIADPHTVSKEIIKFWPAVEESVKELELSDFTLAVYNDSWTKRPYQGRLVAIGDVAHGTSPQLGQGCTMALLDAWLFASCMTNQSTLENACARWWSLRKNQLGYIRQLSRFLTPYYQSDNHLHGLVRDWIMAPVGRLPWMYNLQLRTLAAEVFLKYD